MRRLQLCLYNHVLLPLRGRHPGPPGSGIKSYKKAVRAARAEDCPSINITPVDKATKEAWDVILAANDVSSSAEFLFRHGDQPCRLEHADDGHLVPRVLTQDRLVYRLNDIAWWEKTIKEGTHRVRLVPIDIVKNVLATPDPPLPILDRIVEVPVLAPDGSIHDKPGYSAKTHVWYEPNPELTIPPLSKRRPTKEEVKRAKDLILEEVFGEFPFVSEADKAHMLCVVLQPIVRDLISGPTPLYVPQAPTTGTGKGLLVKVTGLIINGREIPAMAEGGSEEEWRKRITSTLLRAPEVVLLDNLQAKLDSAAFSALLTSELWEDRKLGHTENLTLKNRATWIATGNNPKFSDEIIRRVIRIRIDSGKEHPEDRTFRKGDLEGWVREHRGELIWAALTLARAWICAGRPVPAGQRLLGSFEGWSRVMGGILQVAGVPGFLGNLDDMRESAGTERDDMLPVLITWHDQHKGRAIRTKDLGDDLLVLLGVDPTHKDTAHRIAGKKISQYEDRPFGDYVLRRGAERGKVATWYVQKLR